MKAADRALAERLEELAHFLHDHAMNARQEAGGLVGGQKRRAMAEMVLCRRWAEDIRDLLSIVESKPHPEQFRLAAYLVDRASGKTAIEADWGKPEGDEAN